MSKKSLAFGRAQRTESYERKARTEVIHQPNGQEKESLAPFLQAA
jgi:hypothetical protein